MPTFEQAIKSFANAACELSEAWQREDHTGDYFSDGYPFESSFDELVIDILEWRDKQTAQKGSE